MPVSTRLPTLEVVAETLQDDHIPHTVIRIHSTAIKANGFVAGAGTIVPLLTLVLFFCRKVAEFQGFAGQFPRTKKNKN